jgi:methionyl-tRNA synthetase
LERVLYVLGESLRILGIVLAPFLPDAAVRIRQALGQTAEPQLAHAAWGGLQPGAPVRKLSGLFPRVDQRATATAGVAADRPVETLDRASAKDGESAGPITKDQFARLDLRVAQVLAAEPVAKSRKLLKLTVSLGGDESRTVVAGIAEHYRPDELVGKKVVIVANLEPARLMGIESQGMLLAGSAQGQLSILVLDRDLPPGARVT